MSAHIKCIRSVEEGTVSIRAQRRLHIGCSISWVLDKEQCEGHVRVRNYVSKDIEIKLCLVFSF